MAVRISVWFLNGIKQASPSNKLARMLPAKHVSIQDNQQHTGCLREKVLSDSETRVQENTH